ncbi:hypothetical protein LA374_00370 [Aeromonas schubertii]|uniref:Uncharacterized protein n=1 Tax=Aeromonas schubertii TaxID=652 RepID=A0ABS7V6G6_9GAMM|nr:hypothetical protein [Aeromonas schubertii]MBZ6064672.1 hypothetical protein [Aeromonas schubertii]
MGTALILPFQTANQPEPAATQSAGECHLAAMRALFGRTGAEARWERLSAMQRAVICYAARINPREGMEKALHEFDLAEREALRRAIGDLLALGDVWGGGMDRREWAAIRAPQPVEDAAVEAAQEEKTRAALAAEVSQLVGKVAVMQQVATVSRQ